MALLTRFPEHNPTYYALSTDIVDNKISGASIAGARVYITDTNVWYFIKSDLTLQILSLPNPITMGNKTDAKSTATDATAVSVMQVLKQISYTLQNPSVTSSVVLLDYGTASSGGSDISLVDDEKNFEADVYNSKLVKIVIDGVEYIRTITDTLMNSITFASLGGSVATAILGAPEAGEVTIETDGMSADYNAYTVEVVVSSGNNMNLSSSFADGVMTVYLGTDAEGAADNSKNTATAIAESISQIPDFTATMTGAGGVIAVTENPVHFTGGADAIIPVTGDPYYIY
jgi:hypothetical protein